MNLISKTIRRRVIKIDEEKCDGCGECIPNCPEGAIAIVNGKAKLVNEPNCDGLGACIGHCPRGAITVEERDAPVYDEIAVLKEVIKRGETAVRAHLEHLKQHNELEHLRVATDYLKSVNYYPSNIASKTTVRSGCPGSMSMSFLPKNRVAEPDKSATLEDLTSGNEINPSKLTHWPIQLHLINSLSPHYQESDLLLAADCVPFAFADFHKRFLSGKTLAIACPKLDTNQDVYLDKLVRLIDDARIKSITVVIMQVPCCFGLFRLAQKAVSKATRPVAIELVVVSLQGKILKHSSANAG
ncbi:MAG: ATP-binding protein [Verrucomicrobiia bacterium]